MKFGISPHLEAQLVPYVGYARRFASGLAAEVGADYSAFTGPGSYHYAEVYAGVASDNVSARLYYAPRYFGREPGSFYGEINVAQPLGERVRLLAHVGMLVNRGSYPPYGPSDRRVLDGRIGAAFDIEAFTLQASWVGIGSDMPGYPIAQSRRSTVVVTLSRAF